MKFYESQYLSFTPKLHRLECNQHHSFNETKRNNFSDKERIILVKMHAGQQRPGRIRVCVCEGVGGGGGGGVGG